MDIPSLPTFPPPVPTRPDGTPQGRGWRPNRRQARALGTAAKFVAIVGFLAWIRHAAIDIERTREAERARAAAPPPPPIDFRVVVEWFGRVRNGATRAEVEQHLGRPTERRASGPEVDRFEDHWWNGGKNIFPDNREWNRWTDPADPNRWAAVVYVRLTETQTVHGKLKKGF